MLVATTAFRDAAAHQSRSLGFEPAIVWVSHPVQNRTRDELAALAEDAAGSVLAALGSDGPHRRGRVSPAPSR